MRLLDICCGGGLISAGYWQSGCFSEIVGVDIEDMSPYPFDFIKADATTLTYEFLMQFDFIHASPPCQFYSKLTRDKSKCWRSIPPIKQMLFAAGVPHVIENVEGSGHDLKPNVVIRGRDVGLPMERKRYFYCSFISDAKEGKQKMSSAAGSHINTRSGSNVCINDGTMSRLEMIEAMGLEKMNTRHVSNLTKKHIEQGVPPIMATTLIRMYTNQKFMIG